MWLSTLLPRITIFLFDLLIVFIFCTTIYYFYYNNQKVLEGITQEKHNELSLKVKEKIINYLAIPPLVNKQNAASTPTEYVNDLSKNKEYYYRQLAGMLTVYPTIAKNYIGNKKGEFIEAIREKSEITIAHKYPSEEAFYYYPWDEKNKKIKENENENENENKDKDKDKGEFDLMKRPWYTSKYGWSKIYKDYNSKEYVVTAVYPIKDDNSEELLGVFGCEFLFSDMNKKLIDIKNTYKMPDEAAIFLIDSEKHLLSTSTKDSIIKAEKNDINQVFLENSSTDLLKKITNEINNRSLESMKYFYLNDRHYLIKIIPIPDSGLDWSLIVATPVKHFKIDDKNSTMLWTIGLAILLTLIMGFTSMRLKKRYLIGEY